MLVLSEIRKQRNLTVNFISQLVGLTVDEYKFYENDKTGSLLKQNQKLLNQLAKILGVNNDDLFQTRPINNLSEKFHLSNRDEKLVSALMTFHNKII